MLLQRKRVTRKIKEYREIVGLMKSAFPPEERIPVWRLNILAKADGVHFTAYYDNGLFCGITYTIETDSMKYILYFAVNDKIRSNGYGSRIISQLKEELPHKEIILHVETPDSAAANYRQRLRRIAFYEKNNFFHCRYKLLIDGMEYCVLSTERDSNRAEFQKIISRYRIGRIEEDK